MSAQEAAWYLLRQPMSHSSRKVVYIPTVYPQERYKSKKRHVVVERENLAETSTDIWTKTIIQKYEERPESLSDVCLADFVSWYSPVYRRKTNRNQENEDHENFLDSYTDENEHNESEVIDYRRRSLNRNIRYRNYGITDVKNYKREMVTLYYPFRNEHVDIMDVEKFLDLYDANADLIMAKREEYESNINIQELMNELRELCQDEDTLNNLQRAEMDRTNFVRDVVDTSNENNDDMFHAVGNEIAVVKKRSNVMSKEDYCQLLQKTNPKQRELILEFIHRLCTVDSEPIQIYLAGPAGSGKTFTIKFVMETLNRFGQQHSELRNAYIACASTGKAAINLNSELLRSLITFLNCHIMYCSNIIVNLLVSNA